MLDDACVYDKLQVTIGKKTSEEHRGMMYQSKGKERFYTSAQSDRALLRVYHK